jgi:hypothetical protein
VGGFGPAAGLPASVVRLRLTGIWARFLANGAERKLGGKAEAMPHNFVSKKPRGIGLPTPRRMPSNDGILPQSTVNTLVGQTIGLCRLPFFGDPSNRVSPCGANGQAAKLGIFPRISVLSA